jgi:exodeoxyribonuclease V alpha subunit
MEKLVGYVERITYQSAENGYTVAHLKCRSFHQTICIVGFMPALQPGETICCDGTWKRHLIHGNQFQVQSYQIEAPADVIGIKKYLGSGLISGIGPVYAEKIVEKFGTETLNIIDQTPEKLAEVSGIGPKRIEQIKNCWNDQKSIRNVMIFLQSCGVSPGFAQKIFKTYRENSIAVVKENPYTLARSMIGVGFKTADNLANKLGIAKEAPQRVDAGIEYVLSCLSEEGHVCYPTDELLTVASEMLDLPQEIIQVRITTLEEEGRLVLASQVHEGLLRQFVWLKPLYLAESGIAREIRRLQSRPSPLRRVDVHKALAWVQNQFNIHLAQNQVLAVQKSLIEKMHIITGGPGTGKSTITKTILAITEKLTSKIILCAPTGRAAKRMAEITGKEASTIHSLLEYDFKVGKFKRNKENPLDCDLIIIDESSMIDTYLMYSLLKAIPDRSRVLFVGDINQLPSVGPGNVLRDMIDGNAIPVTLLNEIFRQAAGSSIVVSAHQINKGLMPDCANIAGSDFFFIEASEPEIILKNIVGLVCQRLPKKYGFQPLQDIQVLAPMKKGVIGTENLNSVLQENLNRRGNPFQWGGNRFFVGDKVMQLRNDYKKEVYNGDIGYISKIDLDGQQVCVSMDGREVFYDYSDLDELVLAYAASIHKYQGSECPCIVIPVHTSHFKLLHRNLLYTGVTRGKKLVVLVGTKKALSIAVHNDDVKKRYTALHGMLIDRMNTI